MHFIKYCLCLVFMEFSSSVPGNQYNLTGSSEYAMLGYVFNWACDMFIPPDETNNGIRFLRNNVLCVIIKSAGNICETEITNGNYTYNCSSQLAYTLTIPAKKMIEYEQNSTWKCESVTNSNYKSPDVILKIAIDVQNVSLIPPDNPLTIRKGTQREVTCVVNRNAVPPPTFSWYVGPTAITSDMGRSTNAIKITGNENDNSKILECRATNNNKTKAVNTTLNVEFPPVVKNLSNDGIIEGRDLSVTCQATPGNPNSTIFYWTKVDNLGFRQNGKTLKLPNIQRNSCGTYTCTAQNNYSNGENGIHRQHMVVDVLYPPSVNTLSKHDKIEGRDLSVTCQATPGNPNSTTFYWTNVDNLGFRQNGKTLRLPNIQRNSSGTYRCTAENIYSNGGKGKDNQTMGVNVLYPPVVIELSNQIKIEGSNLSIACQAIPGNPNSSTFYWTKEDNPGFRQNGATLQLPNIQRNSSGTYTCTTENIYSNGEKGTDNQTMDVNVLYKPEILHKSTIIVNETDYVELSREIVSNPLANISWYNGSQLLHRQIAVRNALFIIKKAMCTDTKNFTLVASNTVQENVSALVELIVNCKPRSIKTNFTLGVTETTGIEFSTTVIAYPEPSFEFKHENGTINNQMTKSIKWNGINNFTFHLSQAVVNQSNLGVYHLIINNTFGNITIFVNVISQRKPCMPENIEINCEVTRARVQWTSSFNGGDPQSFTAIALNGQQSDNISDKGEDKIHETYVQNLQSSTTYVFYVCARNRHGYSFSNNISCTTLAESSGNLPLIAGGAAAGGIALAIIVIVIVVLLRIYTKHEKKAGKSQRFENEVPENKEADDDGMRENILYVSAGPKVDEKPESAVYAAVNKKTTESNSNVNVYADVNKSGHTIAEGAVYSDVKPKRGLFKKDGNPKQKKGKKQKSKQDVADVYENSEDISMSSKSDNVYSNAGQKVQNKEERGYKNKDGLLYVEVQFDPKSDKRNQTIHGDDEKTDYATVEFPMAASTHE